MKELKFKGKQFAEEGVVCSKTRYLVHSDRIHQFAIRNPFQVAHAHVGDRHQVTNSKGSVDKSVALSIAVIFAWTGLNVANIRYLLQAGFPITLFEEFNSCHYTLVDKRSFGSIVILLLTAKSRKSPAVSCAIAERRRSLYRHL